MAVRQVAGRIRSRAAIRRRAGGATASSSCRRVEPQTVARSQVMPDDGSAAPVMADLGDDQATCVSEAKARALLTSVCTAMPVGGRRQTDDHHDCLQGEDCSRIGLIRSSRGERIA